MSYQVELSDRSPVEKDFALKIEANAFDGRFQQELSRLASKSHIKGFRPGRAPKAMLVKMYGERIHSDIISDFVGEALRKTVDENKLSIVGTSDFSVESVSVGEPISVKMVISLVPQPELEKCEGFEVEVSVKKVTDDVIADRMEKLRDMFAKDIDVEDRSVVQEGDVVFISYHGEIEGVEEDGLQGKDVRAELGKKELPENIEKALIGVSIGEIKEVTHTFDDTPNEAMKGKEVLFKITLNKIQIRQRPELDDEMAKQTGVAESLSELNEFVKKDIARGFTQHNRDARDAALIDAVVKENDFEVPQALLDREIRVLLAEMRVLDPGREDFHQTPVAQYREIFKDRASERVKRGIVVEQLIKKFSIEPTDQDVDSVLSALSQELEVDRADIDREYGYPSEMEDLKRLAAVRLLTDKLAESSKITEKEIKDVEGA